MFAGDTGTVTAHFALIQGYLPGPQPVWIPFRKWASHAIVSLVASYLHLGSPQDCAVIPFQLQMPERNTLYHVSVQ